jgi:hypothetical protein
LVVMPPSPAHEGGIYAIQRRIFSRMQLQEERTPQLDQIWRLQCNRSVFYERKTEAESYQADLTLFCKNKAVLHHECTFSQREGDLLCKVGRMLEDPACWGILVIRIQEVDKWSPPKRSFKQDDFISPSSWEAAVEAMQQDKPFGGVSMGGSKWTEDVDVDVCFFPSSWMEGDPMPTLVCHAALSDI